MLPPDILDGVPDNLSRRAIGDLLDILEESARQYHRSIVLRSRDRLAGRCAAVLAGTAEGHRRPDLPPDLPFRFVNEPPWVIAFDPDTRLVLRILHEKRDFPALLR